MPTLARAVSTNGFWRPPAAETALGAETRLREAGYTMLVTSSQGSAQLEAAAERLQTQQKAFEKRLEEKRAKITAGDDLAPGVIFLRFSS